MVTVLDSWALMAFFGDEPAATDVEALLDNAETNAELMLLSAVNWGEIYYSIARTVSAAEAENTARILAAMPIKIIGVSEDLIMVRQAAIYKSRFRMSYADCFAAALAKLYSATLVTGDLEFKPLDPELTIRWLPR